MNRMAQGVSDDHAYAQSVYLGSANSAAKGAADADIEPKFGLCVSAKGEVDWLVSQHAAQTSGHWEVHGGGSQTCLMYTHKGQDSAFRASSNFVRLEKKKRKVNHPCFSSLTRSALF